MLNQNIHEIIDNNGRDFDILYKDKREMGRKNSNLKINEENDFSMVSNSSEDFQVTFPDDDLGFLNNIKRNISDFKNKIKFNLINIDNRFNLNEFKSVQIFDKNFNPKTNYEDINKIISNEIIWISYRNNFDPIVYNNSLYTSDAGWGCMVRSGQMMLANAIYKINIKSENNRKCFNEILMLFLDDPMRYKYIKDNKYFSHFKITSSDVLESINKKESFKSIKQSSSTDEFEYVAKLSDYDSKNSFITPPFSIKNILTSGIKFDKGAGDWFSDNEIIKILKELNEKYFPIEGPKIIDFDNKIIHIDKIIEECFVKKICNCPKSFQVNEDFVLEEDMDFILINSLIETESTELCKCFKNCFLFYNNYYEMKRSFIIFSSMRLGLNKLEDEYIVSVNDYFKIPNNIGIIGGKGTRALYFIGNCDESLIFLDPHFVQESVRISDQSYDISGSYKPIELFHVESKKMTPCITIGFSCQNVKEFIDTISFIREYQNKHQYSIIEVRDFHIKNPMISIYFK